MKLLLQKTSILFVFILSAKTAFPQNVGISSSSSFVPDASAALDVSYTSKGLLVPRVALTATNAAGPITSPATSLLIYNTATTGTSPNNVIPGYYYWNGTAWALLSTSAQSTGPWSTTGNTGTTAGTNFIGTIDNKDFVFKTNNAEAGRFTSGGNLGIGSTAFNATNAEKLLVDAGANSFNVISGKGNLNNYLQLNIQNANAGTAASSDVVATADDGNESNYYVDLGINSSANTANIYGGIHDAYLYNTGGNGSGGNFYIGTSSTGKSLGFLTGGSTVAVGTSTNNERLRIDGTTGNVGIGTISPATKLHVFGANPLTLSGVMPGTNTATDSLLTITNSLVRKLPLSTFAATGNVWSTTGNTGTTAGTNFLGTTDAIDFVTRTNNAERVRVTSAGNVGIGTTTPAQRLDVNGSINAAVSLLAQGSVIFDAANSNTGTALPGLQFGGTTSGETISSKRTTGGNQFGLDFYTSSNLRMSIVSGGNVGIGTNTPGFKLAVAGIVAPSADNSYTLGTSTNRWTIVYAVNGAIQTSDRRLKTNIKTLNYGLKQVMAMQPVSYNWKDKSHPENKIGLIAQDVRKLVPEVVIGNEAKEKLGMNYAELVPVLINAIKEQQKQIDNLKKSVQKLQK